jgi:hypothetical protein
MGREKLDNVQAREWKEIVGLPLEGINFQE